MLSWSQSHDPPLGPDAPAVYTFRIAGHLDDRWSPRFGDLTVTREPDGTTSLTGVVADQAALHGLLAGIRDLGVTLISVAIVELSEASAATQTHTPVASDLVDAQRID